MAKNDFQEMFDHALHIGHRAQKWNPRMKKYIYGERSGIHLLNLELTAKCLEEALDFVSKIVSEGKRILFVSTKPQAIKIIESAAQGCNMPFVVSKWIPGLLTNFSTIKSRIRYLAQLREQEVTGEFEKYTKKEALKLRKTIAELQSYLGGVENLSDKPDALFVVDTVRDAIAVNEARKLRIPIVGIVDTNSDPSVIDYPIPANDDAIKALNYLVGKISDTILSSRKAKK